MPDAVTIADMPLQRERWQSFEALADTTTAALASFGPARRIATVMLVRLLLADLGECDVERRH